MKSLIPLEKQAFNLNVIVYIVLSMYKISYTETAMKTFVFD